MRSFILVAAFALCLLSTLSTSSFVQATTNTTTTSVPLPPMSTTATNTTSSSTAVSETSTTSVSVSSTTVATSTTATDEPSSTTTTTAATTTTTPTPTIPSVYLRISLVNASIAATTAERQAFLNKLAAILGIDSSLLSIDMDSSNSTSLTVKITAANATDIGTQAVNLDSDQLASLGAASVTEVPAPTPTTAEPAPKKLNIPLIAGAAAGGFVLLVVLLIVAKKKSSGGTGQDAGHVPMGPDGTTFRRMEDELKTHRDRQQAVNNTVL